MDRNLAAVGWGRAAVADPAAVARALAPSAPVMLRPSHAASAATATTAMVDEVFGGVEVPATLRSLLAGRAEDLVAYQHASYARRYLVAVRRVADAEHRRADDQRWPITTACARNLYKLMAYKDEYEVARLHLLAAERTRLEAEHGPGVRTRVLLHPPLLRAMGLRHKIGLGRSAGPVFRVLRAGRRLRGTPFDPFGHTATRRTERALVPEYLGLLAAAMEHLGPDNASVVARLAALPDVVRGYEAVKARNVATFRTEAAELLKIVAGSVAPAPPRPLRPTLPLAG
jgi:indolepyruvate ferredoxin oxidoreductase